MARRCLNTEAQRHRVRSATVPSALSRTGADKVRLGVVCDEVSVRNREGKVSSVYSVTNSGGFIPSAEYFSKEVYSKSLTAYKIVEPGMFAYNPSRINVGSVNRWIGDSPVVVSPLYIVVKPDARRVEGSYLNYFLHSKEALCQIRNLTEGTVRDSLKFSGFQRLMLPLPPLPTQQRIAAELDRLCALKKNAEDRLAILDQLVKSRFVEMFGEGESWPAKTIDEMCDIVTDGEHATPRRVEQGIMLLSARNVHDHELQLDEVDYIDDVEYTRIAKRIEPREGDVLLSCSGSVGRCCTVPNGLKFQLVRSVALLRFKKDVVPKFAEYLICSAGIQRQIDKEKTASSQANLFQGKIRKLHGFIPPLALQRDFAAFVAEVDKSKAALRETVATLDQLYRAKLQEYFG